MLRRSQSADLLEVPLWVRIISFALAALGVWYAFRQKDDPLQKAFEISPGAGWIAAQLIHRQKNAEDAGRIFETFRAAPNKTGEAYAYFAYADKCDGIHRLTVLESIPEHVTSEEIRNATAALIDLSSQSPEA